MFKYFLALLVGALLPFAFAPTNIYTLAFIAPAILLYLWDNATVRQAIGYGLLFGIGLFTTGSAWIYISIHQFGNASPWLAALVTALFILILALYPATLGWIYTGLCKRKHDVIRCLLLFPSLWVAWEALRSYLFGGFPWLLLGYSQLATPLRGLAPMISVYGLSWVVAFIAAALVLLARRNSSLIKSICVACIALLVLLGWGLGKIHWTKPVDSSIKVSLVQGNIATTVKWDSYQVINVLKTYRQLTEQHWDSALIVWPEAAIPAFANQVPQYLNTLTRQAIKHHSSIISGIPLADNTDTYYNGLLLLGKHQQQYLKRQLVPFGEYTPLQSVFGALMRQFNIPMSGYSPGPSHQALLQVGQLKIAPFICYETAFPVLALNSSIGSNMIVTILDDGWFGKSIALAQQMQMTQMRALETGRPVLVAANTGITGFVGVDGHIIKAAPIDKQIVITQAITPMQGKTPLMIWRYYTLLGILLLLLIIGCASKRQQ